ncbi:MAG: hypothetical protein ACRCYD_12985 [Plesiomonas sp.]
MKPLYLRFDSEQAAIAALVEHGFSCEDGLLSHPDCCVDVVGIIRGDIATDDDGNITHQEPDIDGWHINLLVPDEYVPSKSAAIVSVKTPVRRWAGY